MSTPVPKISASGFARIAVTDILAAYGFWQWAARFHLG
jgi:hypothetical protein